MKPSGIYSSFSKEMHHRNDNDVTIPSTAVGDDSDKNVGNGPPLSGPSSVQLYFGEGFEDRLELEMEE